MVEQTGYDGTHNLFEAAVGHEMEPIEITITEEMVDRNAWANDDYNPWYVEDSPFGGRIAPPTFLVMQTMDLTWGYYASPPGGGLHAKQEFEFINPLKIGKKIKMTGKLVDRHSKRGRDHFAFEFLAVDETGLEIIRMGMTVVTPAVARTEGQS